MSYALHGTAPRFGSMASRTPGRSLARIRAALALRRRTDDDVPGPRKRSVAASGVSPIAGGASRGAAFLVHR